jgi:hypothetical protein
MPGIWSFATRLIPYPNLTRILNDRPCLSATNYRATRPSAFDDERASLCGDHEHKHWAASRRGNCACESQEADRRPARRVSLKAYLLLILANLLVWVMCLNGAVYLGSCWDFHWHLPTLLTICLRSIKQHLPSSKPVSRNSKQAHAR